MRGEEIRTRLKAHKVKLKSLAFELGITEQGLQKLLRSKDMKLGRIREIEKITGINLLVEVPTNKGGIPLVDATAIGGTGNNHFTVSKNDVKEYYVIPKFSHKTIDFMIEVEGSSMYPKYSSGDIVACTILRDTNFIQWNKTHVIATKHQGILIKRLLQGDDKNSLKMVSDNSNYAPFDVPKDEITGLALVAGVIRLE